MEINICNATAMVALPLVLATDANSTKHLSPHDPYEREPLTDA